MKSVRGTRISATDGGEVVVNAINTLEKRDVMKKAKTNFLSSVCVTSCSCTEKKKPKPN